MRVAVVSHHRSLGGGSRFVQGLLGGMLELTGDDITELALFLNEQAPEAPAFEALAAADPRLTLHFLDDRGALAGRAAPAPDRTLRERLRDQPALVAVYRFVKFTVLGRPKDVEVTDSAEPEPASLQYALQDDVLAELARFDVVYVTWPRLLKPLEIERPVVATFHDFNQRHGFAVFSPEERAFVDAEVSEWLTRGAYPVCSTPFIAEELEAFYPERVHAPSVVYLSTFALQQPDDAGIAAARAVFDLQGGFVLCPTNVGPHKNLVRMVRAFARARRAGFPLPLVFTGGGTQVIGRDPRDEWLYQTPLRVSIDAINEAVADEGLVLDRDFRSLGYVSDNHINALVAAATLVVAPSLYEAGTGPGLDAWSLGTPVAVSAIPPVLQQTAFLGTEAVLFDPEDEGDIAGALQGAVTSADEYAARAVRSREAMGRYGWTDVARGYVSVFRRVIDETSARPEHVRGA